MVAKIPKRPPGACWRSVKSRVRRVPPVRVLAAIVAVVLMSATAAAPAGGRQPQGGAELRIAAVSLPPAELIGDHADATIELTNVGSAAAGDVVLRLDLPVGVRVTGSYLGASACGAADAGRLVCTLGGPLEAGGTTTAVVTFRNDALPAGGEAAVPIAVGVDPSDPAAVHDSAVIRFLFGAAPAPTPIADVGLIAVTASSLAASASVVRLDAVVVNAGPEAARDLTVTYRIPAGVVAVSAHVGQQPCAPFADGEQVCVRRGPVAPGAELASGVMLTNVGVPAGTAVEVGVLVGGTAFVDPDPTDDEQLVTVRFAGGPIPTVAGVETADLSLTGAAPVTGPGPARATVRWTLFSAGPATATGVVVTVGADPPGSLVDASIPGWSSPCPLDPVDRRIRCTLVDPLVPGFERTVVATIDLQAAPAGRTVTVDATVAADRADPDPSNNRSLVSLTAAGQGAAIAPDDGSGELPRSGTPSPRLLGIGVLLVLLGTAAATTAGRSAGAHRRSRSVRERRAGS